MSLFCGMRFRLRSLSSVLGASALSAALVASVTAHAQLPKPLTPTSPREAVTPVVAAGSPRVSLQEYLRLANAQDWSGAAEYLALSSSERPEAAALARRLKIVLDQRLALDLTAVSPLAVGDTTDGDLSGDRIGTIAGIGGREDPVRMVRVTTSVPQRWVFSTATVESVNRWYENLGAPWLREHLAPAFMREGPLHVFYWQWIGLALAVPVLFVLSWLLGLFLTRVLTRVAARTTTEWDDLLVQHLRGPVQLWIMALVASPVFSLLELNARLASGVRNVAGGAVLLSLFWGALRVITLTQHRLTHAAWAKGPSAQARTLVPLLGNFLRVTLAIVALLVALSQFGYPVGTLLAGLGIGGIAVALAAQKTVEHLFGSVSLAADHAFRVGDWVRAGPTEGTVERIGLRSTSVRTNERTIVRIPNGRLADERIETFGERDRMFLRTDIDLAYNTPSATIDSIRDAIEAALRAHEKIWPDKVRVHVVGFTESAIRINVLAWFATHDWSEFLMIRHRMLVQFLRIVEAQGSSFALPSRTVYHVTQPLRTDESG